jgi:hypothetical protein
MSQLSTFFPLNPGPMSNVTFGSVTTGAINASGGGAIQNTPIGNTTPSTGAFTTLTANNGTLTASAPVLDLAQTWNSGATTFTGLRANFTNTASATASLLMDLQVGGTTQFNVTRTGIVRASRYDFPDSDRGISNAGTTYIDFSSGLFRFFTGGGATGNVWLGQNIASPAVTIGGGTGLSPVNTQFGVSLTRDANDALAQRRDTNAQTFNIYNTFTSSTNHERGFLKWSSNVFQIGTEKGSGGGTARQMDFQIDGTNVFSLGRSGGPRIAGLTSYVSNVDSVAQVGFGQFGFVAGGANNAGGILFYDGNGSGVNTRLGLDASNVLGIKSGTAAQAFRIYNTITWERLNIRWVSNECIIDTEAGGTGTLRGLKLGSASTSLLGFYGATPVDRPETVAMSWDLFGSQGDVANAEDVEARIALFDIRSRLIELGLMKTA